MFIFIQICVRLSSRNKDSEPKSFSPGQFTAAFALKRKTARFEDGARPGLIDKRKVRTKPGDGRNSRWRDSLRLRAGQLQHHRERASGGDKMKRILQTTAQSCVLEDKRGMHQIDRRNRRRLLGKVDAMQFESGQMRVARTHLFEVLRIAVDADNARGASAVDAVQPIAAGHAQNRDRRGPSRGERLGEELGQHRKLTNRRRAHVALVVGERDVQPGIVHRSMLNAASIKKRLLTRSAKQPLTVHYFAISGKR